MAQKSGRSAHHATEFIGAMKYALQTQTMAI